MGEVRCGRVPIAHRSTEIDAQKAIINMLGGVPRAVVWKSEGALWYSTKVNVDRIDTVTGLRLKDGEDETRVGSGRERDSVKGLKAGVPMREEETTNDGVGAGEAPHSGEEPVPQSMKAKKQCCIDGCDGPRQARGMCMRHYSRWQNCDQPDLERFKAAGAPMKHEWNAMTAAQLNEQSADGAVEDDDAFEDDEQDAAVAEEEDVEAARSTEGTPPQDEPEEGTEPNSQPFGKRVDIPDGVDALYIGRIGQYITVAGPDGYVHTQIAIPRL